MFSLSEFAFAGRTNFRHFIVWTAVVVPDPATNSQDFSVALDRFRLASPRKTGKLTLGQNSQVLWRIRAQAFGEIGSRKVGAIG